MKVLLSTIEPAGNRPPPPGPSEYTKAARNLTLQSDNIFGAIGLQAYRSVGRSPEFPAISDWFAPSTTTRAWRKTWTRWTTAAGFGACQGVTMAPRAAKSH